MDGYLGIVGIGEKIVPEVAKSLIAKLLRELEDRGVRQAKGGGHLGDCHERGVIGVGNDVLGNLPLLGGEGGHGSLDLEQDRTVVDGHGALQ